MKTKTALAWLLCLSCTFTFAQSAWTNFTNDRLIDDVLVAGNNVWVASQGGLTRKNMQTGEFQTYLASNSPIKGGGILEIERAPDNSMWFVSENAGVFHVRDDVWTHYYDGIISEAYHQIKNLQILSNGDVWFFVDKREEADLNRFVRIRNGVIESFGHIPDEVKSFAVIDEQTIFISDGTTLYQYDASLAQVTETYHSGNSILTTEDTFWEIITDRNGAVIIPCPTRILQWKSGSLSELSTPGLHVNKAFKDGVGNVYLQPPTNGELGIRLVKYNGFTVTYYKDSDLMPYPVNAAPRFTGADSQGRLYAVLWNIDTEYTLYRFDETGWTPVQTQIFPLLDNYQDDVQSDCQGNLWFGSRDGVDVRYADGSWGRFPVEVTPHTYFRVGQMTVDPVNCDVWFANNSNGGSPSIPGIIRISNGTVTEFLHGHANVGAIEASVDGKVYFYSGLTGVGYIENDEVHYIEQLEDIQFVFSLDTDSKGHLYIAPWGPALIKFDGEQATYYGEGELGDLVYGAIVDNDDLVWVYISGGLKMFDGVQFTDYSDIWPSNTFNDMVQDKKGNYWVSTWLDGLYYWDRHSLQHFHIFNSDLSTNSLRGVALDPWGNLIVTQNIGASVLEIPDITEDYRGAGTVFFDYGQDGAFDDGIDIPVPGQKVRDTTRNLWAVTNVYGQYTFYADTPQTNIYRHQLDQASTSTTDNPQGAAIMDEQSTLPEFGFWKPHDPAINVTIINDVPVCNRDFTVHIYLRNESVYTTTGDFTLTYNEELILKESSIPVSHQTNGQIFYEDLSIEPFSVLRITLVFTAPGFTDEGNAIFFEGLFSISKSSFIGFSMDSVRCSYDPNDKKVEPTGEFYHDYSLIADPLKYTIRFQNEGNYKAFDIAIIDTLDQLLDPSTFELLASSHNVETTVTADGIVTFLFPNIDLPARVDDEAGSQGFVSFSVRPDTTLAGLVSIFNKASIYFDFNPPIVTNTTRWHVVDDLAIVSTNEAQGHLSVYPNPTDGILYLTMEQEGDYRVWDATGRQVKTDILQTGSNTIVLDTLSGIYYLQLRSGDRMYAPVKIVVIR